MELKLSHNGDSVKSPVHSVGCGHDYVFISVFSGHRDITLILSPAEAYDFSCALEECADFIMAKGFESNALP